MLRHTIQMVLLSSVVATGGLALADDDAPLAAKCSGGRVLKKGSIASLKAHKITIAGRRTLAAAEVADDIFVEQRQVAAELNAGKDALLAGRHR